MVQLNSNLSYARDSRESTYLRDLKNGHLHTQVQNLCLLYINNLHTQVQNNSWPFY